ncbi:short-chain dehydrogenase/reductase (SDR) superfamily [Synechococcus sp. RS9909]|uniref:oxidoreductase n=1 Tax=unclassified Synechococcus TaxID=2626047 RepID=UPI0000690676|nr:MULTISPECIES: oxidoreductase [unclassified Synechococcus]EAQ70411.1 short-chain dehydrogenase/reductase (SDR) superfamily protein [Synechococcus sp. RS9917]QNI80719.1 short-chain dehydrogenase/reductase (SDR) superfamily [Synechococcus sp. RS9909]
MGWSAADIPDQRGRLALVTGANSGLGLETTRALLAHGATVLMACRNRERGETARRSLSDQSASKGGSIELLDLDLADLESVDRCAQTVRQRFGRLDLLINNAGVMAPPRQCSRQGYELQFATNHLSHMALTRALLPLMEGQPDARVVTVTSGAQYFGRIAWEDPNGEQRYDRWQAYGQSKLANVMFALELDRKLRDRGSSIRSLAAHPGLARTNLQPASVSANGSRLEALAYRLMDPLFQSAAMGALPQLHAATAASAQSGEHYGPNRLGGLRGYPKRQRVAPAAEDPQQRERLWDLSLKLIEAGPALR